MSIGRLAFALAVAVLTGVFCGGFAGAGSAIIYAGGIPFAFIVPWAAFIFVGFVVGEATSLAANRKRGVQLKIVALIGMLAALGAEISLESVVYRALVLIDGPSGSLLISGFYGIIAVVIGFYLATRRF